MIHFVLILNEQIGVYKGREDTNLIDTANIYEIIHSIIHIEE